LHVDHVGWNTMKAGGRWVPTFPNARYLIGKKEWDFWGNEPADPGSPIMDESVRPILDAGLADLVDPDHKLTSEVWLEPTHGHTPGHVSVRISSGGEDAVITGDMMHHPSQIARPEWHSGFDWNPEQGRETRRKAIQRWSGGNYLVIGTHFASPTAGKIVRDGDTYRFAV
ncbi:MAG TPA: MBL fold metallo-hydrolase, partial [Dongiaceae bacterium]|nr:MBL fold metallo-hydrolase [Dongiaceae bacterium]